MVFTFARVFVGGNQVSIELRKNHLDRWKGLASGKRSFRQGVSGSGKG